MTEKVEGRPTNEYLRLASKISETLNYFDIPHAIVGGVISSQITNETRIGAIDPVNRVYTLENTKDLSLRREDGSVRDVDIIAFCPNKPYFDQVKKWLHVQYPHVPISIEGVRFPKWPKRRSLTQFVVGTSVDEEGRVRLEFDDTELEIDPETLAIWTLQTPEGNISVFNPVTHFYRYLTRAPSGIKPKDKEKAPLLVNLAWDFINKVVPPQEADLFLAKYREWRSFIRILHNFSHPLWTEAKIRASRAYWASNVSNGLAHGRGSLGKALSRFSDRMTG